MPWEPDGICPGDLVESLTNSTDTLCNYFGDRLKFLRNQEGIQRDSFRNSMGIFWDSVRIRSNSEGALWNPIETMRNCHSSSPTTNTTPVW
eukprot:3236779-Pyramimonas_sp.AAC.1